MTFSVDRQLRVFLLLVMALCISCKRAPQQPQPGKPAAAGPQLEATVVTIRTTVAPENKTHEHTLVIAGDRARSTGEHDVWRLFDLKANRVTFVDDVAKTIRTEPLTALVQRRGAALAGALPPHYPRATLARSTERKALQGVNAQQVVIASGEYRRELWFGDHPQIPDALFAMMHASDLPSSPLAPMMREVDDALDSERGFPLSDRTEVPMGNDKLVVERTVTSVTRRPVPESLFALPRDYADVTPKPKTDEKKKAEK